MLKNLIWSYRQSFRLWMRQRTVPVTVEEAELKQFFWAKLYAFSAFGCLVYISYCVCKTKSNFWSDEGEEMASLIAVSDKNPVRVIKMVGFSKVDEVMYSKDEVQEFQKSFKEKRNNSK